MCACGLVRRLCTQSGLVSAPALDPMMIVLPSIVRYASGASRGWPDLAPVVVSSRRVAPSKGPPTLPPLVRDSSTMLLLSAFIVSASGISVMTPQGTRAGDLSRPLQLNQRDHALSARIDITCQPVLPLLNRAAAKRLELTHHLQRLPVVGAQVLIEFIV